MDTLEKTNTILRTTAAPGRDSIARNPGSVKSLIDRSDRLLNAAIRTIEK
jgi:hypothetical protein